MNKPALSGKVTGILAGAVFALVTAWLFYDLEPIALILLGGIPFFAIGFERKKRRETVQAMDIQFKDALQYLKNGLDAGYSAEHSLADTAKGLEGLYGRKAIITREFGIMAGKLSAGMTMEQAFGEFADSVDAAAVREFADLFKILKRTGGNLNKVIRRTVSNLNDTINLRRDLNVVIAAKRGEFMVMSAIPYGILLYLKLLAPEMSAPLYHSTFGISFMTGMLAGCLACFVFGMKTINRTLGLKV